LYAIHQNDFYDNGIFHVVSDNPAVVVFIDQEPARSGVRKSAALSAIGGLEGKLCASAGDAS
jgi:hypothetical protein